MIGQVRIEVLPAHNVDRVGVVLLVEPIVVSDIDLTPPRLVAPSNVVVDWRGFLVSVLLDEPLLLLQDVFDLRFLLQDR